MENITFRNKRQNTIRRNKSECDLSRITMDRTLLSSTLSEGSDAEALDVSTKSVPTNAGYNLTDFQQLNEQVMDLRLELATAHDEITNLNYECNNLKQKLEYNNKQIHLLKKVSSESLTMNPVYTPFTPRNKVSTPLLNKLTNVKIRLSRSQTNHSAIITNTETPKTHVNSIPQRLVKQMSDSIGKDILSTKNCNNSEQIRFKNSPSQLTWTLPTIVGNDYEQKSMKSKGLTKEVNKNTENNNSEQRRMIYIIGDEQAQNLAGKMLKNRQGKWNDDYGVFGMVKSSANSSEILRTCENMSKNVKQKDIVVLCFGIWDNNVYKYMSNLCNILYLFRKQKVFITNVQYNPYLNEYMLNKQLHLIVKNYSNCKLIHLTNINVFMNKNNYFTTMLSAKISLEIDAMTYNEKFLTFPNKTKYQLQSDVCIENKPSRSKMPDNNKKGTILHYFNPKNQAQPNVKPKMPFKKGTIPYLFHKMNANQSSVKETSRKSNTPFFRSSQ